MKAIVPIRGLRSRRQIWSPDEIALLRAIYPDSTDAELERTFRRPIGKIYQAAQRFGVRKSARYYAEKQQAAGRLLARAGAASRYPSGHVPANKGLRRPGWAAGRMRETQFKKGRPAHEARNYVPIGTEKVDPKRQVLMRKITDDPTIFPVKRWKPVHVLVWEAAHGPVPAGHICVFKPGRKTFVSAEITADRLEVITLADNMRRNTIHARLPAPLKRAVMTLGQLNRRIREKEERHAQHD